MAQAADEVGEGSVVIVVDSSGSMKESDGNGRTRMEAAKVGLKKVIDGVPEDSDVGLRLYGASIEDGPKSCKDSRLVVPVDGVDKAAMKKAIAKMRPLGNTPIAYSLKQAAKDLEGKETRSIVLVSDGEENCGGDPCKVAREISDSGTDLHVDVIGLQVDAKSRNQLSCIAKASGGTYYDVPDAVNLPNTLERLSVRAARGYEPVGKPIEGGTAADDAPELTDGQWLDNIGDSGTEFYEVLDPGKGALHLGATVRPVGLGTADSLDVEMTVTAADGTECGSASETGIGAFSGSSPVTTTWILAGEDKAECGEGPYTVAVESPVDSEQPLSLWVHSEAGVKDTGSLPPAATEEEWLAEGAAFAADPQAVEGSLSPTDAPTIQPGTYTDTLLKGEVLFYRVDLDWGQQLVCEAKVAPNSRGPRDLANLSAETFGYNAGEIPQSSDAENESTWAPTDGAEQVKATTPPVRYLNRTVDDDSLLRSSLPGSYYCAFQVGNNQVKVDEIGDLALTLNVSVVGTAGEGEPEYLAEPESAKKAGDAKASANDDGSNLAVLGGIGFGILALLAAALWFLRRVRRA